MTVDYAVVYMAALNHYLNRGNFCTAEDAHAFAVKLARLAVGHASIQ